MRESSSNNNLNNLIRTNSSNNLVRTNSSNNLSRTNSSNNLVRTNSSNSLSASTSSNNLSNLGRTNSSNNLLKSTSSNNLQKSISSTNLCVLPSEIDLRFDTTVLPWFANNAVLFTFPSLTPGDDGTYPIIQCVKIPGNPNPNPSKKNRNKKRITLVLIPGWSESYLKYQEVFYDLHTQFDGNVDIYCMDHVSQGLSGRWCSHIDRGWANDFQDYVDDVEYFIKGIVSVEKVVDSPMYLFAHSMGGLISSYVVARNPGLFNKIVLCSPMFDVAGVPNIPPAVLRLVSAVSVLVGNGQEFASGGGTKEDHRVPLAEVNECCSCQDRLNNWNKSRKDNPVVITGGVTWGWFFTSTWNRLRSDTITYEQVQSFEQSDILLIRCDDETIVDKTAMDEFSAVVRSCELFKIPNSKHEPLFEDNVVRDLTIKRCVEFYNTPEKEQRLLPWRIRTLPIPPSKVMRQVYAVVFWAAVGGVGLFFGVAWVGVVKSVLGSVKQYWFGRGGGGEL